MFELSILETRLVAGGRGSSTNDYPTGDPGDGGGGDGVYGDYTDSFWSGGGGGGGDWSEVDAVFGDSDNYVAAAAEAGQAGYCVDSSNFEASAGNVYYTIADGHVEVAAGVYGAVGTAFYQGADGHQYAFDYASTGSTFGFGAGVSAGVGVSSSLSAFMGNSTTVTAGYFSVSVNSSGAGVTVALGASVGAALADTNTCATSGWVDLGPSH